MRLHQEEQCLNMIATGKFPEPEWRRACGDCICTVCNRDYFSHPVCIPYWTFHILCDGSHVKL